MHVAARSRKGIVLRRGNSFHQTAEHSGLNIAEDNGHGLKSYRKADSSQIRDHRALQPAMPESLRITPPTFHAIK